MKRFLIVATLSGILSLPAFGEGIYVGDVKFTAQEICSKEDASFLHPNSGCLPLARVSNIQNYYYEGKRLPISHGEAKRVDAAAQGIVMQPAALLQAAGTLEKLNAILVAANSANKTISGVDANKTVAEQLAIVNAAQSTVSAVQETTVLSTDAKKRVLDLLDKEKVQKEVDALRGAANTVDGAAKPVLAALKLAIEKLNDLYSGLKKHIVTFSSAVAAQQIIGLTDSTDRDRLTKSLKQVEAGLSTIASGVDVSDVQSALSASAVVDAGVSIENTLQDVDLPADAISARIGAIRALSDSLPKKDSESLRTSLNDAASGLENILVKVQGSLAPFRELKYAEDAVSRVVSATGVHATINHQARKVRAELNAISISSDPVTAEMQFSLAVQAVNEILDAQSSASAIENNLLPSLIGRVFVTEQTEVDPLRNTVEQFLPSNNKKPKAVRYGVPWHGGNFQFVPPSAVGRLKLKMIPTEVLLKTDLSGVIKERVGVNATVDIVQMLNQAMTGLSINYQRKQALNADISMAMSRTSMGSGNYYFVSMTDEYLDELVGNKLKGCISSQPASRDEARQASEEAKPRIHDLRFYDLDGKHDGDTTYNTCGKGAAVKEDIKAELGIPEIDLRDGEGLGIVTGVAILRTRSGQTEACLSVDVSVYNPSNQHNSVGNNATTCSELRDILEGHGVPKTEIPSALAKLNAGYRRESYKILKIGDHASVLALQWIPVALPAHNKPDTPTNVTVTPVAGRKFTVTFTAPHDGGSPITKFIATAKNETDINEKTLDGKTELPITLENCKLGNSYTVSVVAINNNGRSNDGSAAGVVTCAQ